MQVVEFIDEYQDNQEWQCHGDGGEVEQGGGGQQNGRSKHLVLRQLEMGVGGNQDVAESALQPIVEVLNREF